ncbi:MAG: M24 family metallopeptidase, partial [Candidatus Methanofastidiosia archaeon]
GVKELEVSALAAKAMIDEGAEHVPYLPLVESGEHGWIGYRFPTDKRIRKGEMIYIDTGACIVNGYNGDIARVKIVGKPSKKQTEIYRVMYDMLFEATDKLRHRTNTKEVVEAARKVAKKSGYEKNIYFGIIGHGIGTDLHEPPTIGERVVEHKESEVLQKNMVVCLEPGILLPNVGGGHLENMILIRDGKPEILTKTGFEEEIL